MPIKSKIRSIPDYPKKGIMFRDITTLIQDPVGFRLVIDTLSQRYLGGTIEYDVIAGIELKRLQRQEESVGTTRDPDRVLYT